MNRSRALPTRRPTVWWRMEIAPTRRGDRRAVGATLRARVTAPAAPRPAALAARVPPSKQVQRAAAERPALAGRRAAAARQPAAAREPAAAQEPAATREPAAAR